VIRAITILSLLTLSVTAQEFGFEFFRYDYEKYRFAALKLRPNHPHLDYMLYDSLQHCQQLVNHHVAFPLKEKRYRTDPAQIERRVFVVDDIIDQSSIMSGGSFLGYPIFQLRDSETSDTLYFKYNPNSMDRFPFMVNGVIGDEDEFCHLLEKKELPFSEGVYIRTPNRGTIETAPVSLHRTTDANGTHYNLHLRTYGTRPHSRVKGVKVYLKDGSRITRNNAGIRFTQTAYGYEYSASIKLNADELDLLLQSPIAKQQLYIYSFDVTEAFGHQLMMLSRCLKQLK
jgi:hypothetical protein